VRNALFGAGVAAWLGCRRRTVDDMEGGAAGFHCPGWQSGAVPV